MSGMKRYQNPDVYDALAAEYVMGTLRGRARDRFETLIQQRPYIQYSVDMWEKRLHGLNQVLPEEKPGPAVWKNISQSIGTVAPDKPSLFERIGFWQMATGLLSVALAVAVVLPGQNPAARPFEAGFQPSFVSVLESRNDKPMMYTTGSAEQGFVEVRMAEMPSIPDDEDWVLWAIPRNGGAPVAVGTLLRDSMQTRIELTEQEWQQRMMGTEVFGVTSEPRRGNRPAGQYKGPSGEIMYKGKCLEFT